MDIVSAEHFVNDQLPFKYQTLIPSTLKTSYDAARILAANEPILQVESAIDNGGRLITWAVDLAFRRLIESGQWPFEYRWRPFAKPTGRYLEVRLPHSVVTISNVADPKYQPRNVVFRENGRLNNQHFLPLPEFDDERLIDGIPSFLLLHGHKELRFAHLGVPNKNHSHGFIFRTKNLLSLPHEVFADVPPLEETDIEATMTLKEEIEKWRTDHGE